MGCAWLRATTWPGTPTTTELAGTGLTTTALRADAAARADLDGAEDLGAGADDDVITDGGMALAFGQAGAAERDAVVEGDVVADFGGLADDHAHAVIDEETGADLGAGVDFDAGGKARRLGKPARDKFKISPPQSVRGAVRPQGVQAGVEQGNLPAAARGRVALQDGIQVLFEGFEHDGLLNPPGRRTTGC